MGLYKPAKHESACYYLHFDLLISFMFVWQVSALNPHAPSWNSLRDRFATPARQVDLHSLTPTLDQNPDDIALISLIDDLVLRPSWNICTRARGQFVTSRLLFVTSRCLALNICSDGPDRVHSRTSEKNPVTSGSIDYSL